MLAATAGRSQAPEAQDKKRPQPKLGPASLTAVITLRHLLREEKQGVTT
jgi:hypothetical protein